MGGLGSTRWLAHARRQQVEEAFGLSVAVLKRDGSLGGWPSGGPLQWVDTRRGEVRFAVDVEVGAVEAGGQWRRLTLSTPDWWQYVELERLPCLGGRQRRWWFRCPAPRCGSRRAFLYARSAEGRFACRACLGLVHRSAQRHDKRVDRLWRNPEAALRLLDRFERGGARPGGLGLILKLGDFLFGSRV